MIAIEAARCFVIFGFGVFNLSVIVYVYRERKRDAKIKAGFYVLFLAASIADWIELIMKLVVVDMPNAFEFVELSTTIIPAKVLVVHGWCLVFQALMHSTIAFNRFSCFQFRDRFEFLWRARYLTVLLVAQIIIAVVAQTFNYVSPSVYWVVDGRISGTPVVDPTAMLVGMIVMVSIYVLSSAVSFFLSLSTLAHLVSIRRGGQLKGSHTREIRLFVHSLLMLVLQASYAGMFVICLEGLRTTVIAKIFYFLIGNGGGDAYMVVGPVFLIILSQRFRRGYLKYYGMYYHLRKQSPVTFVSSKSCS